MKKFIFNKALRILLITNGFILLAGAMLAPIYALFVDSIGGSLLDAGLTGAFFALAAGVTTIIAGKYADRKKRPEFIVATGYTIMGVGFILFMFVNNIWFLFFVQMLIGFAEALYSPAFDALYSHHLSPKKAGREWGAWEATHYFSMAIGAALGGLIASVFGFIGIFFTMAVLCFLSAGYIFHLKKSIL